MPDQVFWWLVSQTVRGQPRTVCRIRIQHGYALLDIPPDRCAEGGETVELKPCPLCGCASLSRISRDGYGRRSKAVYGRLCSNPKCEWSYAYITFSTQEQADKEWNKKVDRKEQMLEWSRRLKPCSCGGTAWFVHEHDGGNFGLWFVRCDRCQKLLTASETMDAIIEAWNRRATDG